MIFSQVKVAKWPPFGRELLIRFTVCSLCILAYCSFSYFPLWFEGGTLVLLASVPGHYLSFTFYNMSGYVLNICKYENT